MKIRIIEKKFMYSPNTDAIIFKPPAIVFWDFFPPIQATKIFAIFYSKISDLISVFF